MKLLISLSALLLSIILVQMGIGSLRPFDTISGQALGFTPIEIGIIASGHFAGFFAWLYFQPVIGTACGAFACLCRDGGDRRDLDHCASALSQCVVLGFHPYFCRFFGGWLLYAD